MKEEILINTQLALFFDQPIIKPEELWQSFNSRMGDVFDRTPPMILPVPNDPNLYDVPIVQIASNDGMYSCNIARSRVDFFISGIGEQKFSDIKENLLTKIEDYYNFFSEKTKIKRIGFVRRFFLKEENQTEVLTQLLKDDFKKLYKGEVYDSFIRYSLRTKIVDFQVNSLTLLEKFSARISGVGENVKGILITLDFNTIPEENYREKFNRDNIKKFIEESEIVFKLEDIKKILWPEQNQTK